MIHSNYKLYAEPEDYTVYITTGFSLTFLKINDKKALDSLITKVLQTVTGTNCKDFGEVDIVQTHSDMYDIKIDGVDIGFILDNSKDSTRYLYQVTWELDLCFVPGSIRHNK